MTELENKLSALLKTFSDEDIIRVHNEYCERINAYDDVIYHMDALEGRLDGFDNNYSLALWLYFGCDEGVYDRKFNPMRKYYYVDGNDHPVSLDHAKYTELLDRYMCGLIDDTGIIDYAIENDFDYNYGEIRNLLAEYLHGEQ